MQAQGYRDSRHKPASSNRNRPQGRGARYGAGRGVPQQIQLSKVTSLVTVVGAFCAVHLSVRPAESDSLSDTDSLFRLRALARARDAHYRSCSRDPGQRGRVSAIHSVNVPRKLDSDNIVKRGPTPQN